MAGSEDKIPPPPPPSQTPTQQTPHTVSTIKLPILKKGEYDIWAMKMEHYLPHTDYPIWEVIQRGNGHALLHHPLAHRMWHSFHWNTSSTNDVSTAYGVSNSSGHNSQYEHTSSYSLLANQSSFPQLDHEDLEQLDEFDLEEIDLKWQVAMISMRMKKFYKKTGRKLQFDAKEPVGFDKTKVECYSCHKTGHFARECRSKGNQDSRRRDAWNTGNKDKENRRRSGKQEDSKALVTLDGEGVDWTSHSEDKQENYALMACSSSGSDTEYGDQMNKGVLSYENEVFQSVFVSRTSDIEDSLVNDRYAEGMHAVPPPMTGIYIPSGPDKEIDDSQFTYGPKQSKPSESDARSSDFNSYESNCSEETHESMPESVVNEPNVAVPTNAARKVNTVKPIVKNAGPKTGFHKTLSSFRRPFNNTTTLRTNFSKQKVNTAEVNAVSAIGGKRENAVNPSAGCNWRPKIHYWHKISKYNGGPRPRDCATFKDPLGRFKPKQAWICDKKNKVLFTDSECLVLYPEFKLPDADQVLLRIPKQSNMYSFNLENIVPSRGLACLIAKATIDEFNKWHRRLGHVNFKNLNKLMKGNLVRGLPSKIFQNDHTCVACQKGKQHKASYKAKSVRSISQPLQLLHMNLFGPTDYVETLNMNTCVKLESLTQ
ncbi:ribonuclease H-like domain-containing protein [Tanacetum coccineum]